MSFQRCCRDAEVGDREDQVVRAAVLHPLERSLRPDVAPEADVVRVRELVDRHERRADRTVGVEALAERELGWLAGQLHDPVLTKDAIAGRIRRLLAMADKRVGRDLFLGNTIVWLLGPQSSYTSGAILDVSGAR